MNNQSLTELINPLTIAPNLNDKVAKNPSAIGQRVSSLELLQTVNAGFVVQKLR